MVWQRSLSILAVGTVRVVNNTWVGTGSLQVEKLRWQIGSRNDPSVQTAVSGGLSFNRERIYHSTHQSGTRGYAKNVYKYNHLSLICVPCPRDQSCQYVSYYTVGY